MGPKYGVARGIAVYGSHGADGPATIDDLMSRYGRLRVWSLEHGHILKDSSESLAALDRHLDVWNADPSHHGKVDLANEVGAYLGTLIVSNVEGSRWSVWPNGHPVVRLRSGQDIDVTDLVQKRLNNSGASLADIFESTRDA